MHFIRHILLESSGAPRAFPHSRIVIQHVFLRNCHWYVSLHINNVLLVCLQQKNAVR